MIEVTEKELSILMSRIDRCQICLERWVDNPSLTLNAACLLLVKIVMSHTKYYSLEKEQQTLSLVYTHLEKYIKKGFEYNRNKEQVNGK